MEHIGRRNTISVGMINYGQNPIPPYSKFEMLWLIGHTLKLVAGAARISFPAPLRLVLP